MNIAIFLVGMLFAFFTTYSTLKNSPILALFSLAVIALLAAAWLVGAWRTNAPRYLKTYARVLRQYLGIPALLASIGAGAFLAQRNNAARRAPCFKSLDAARSAIDRGDGYKTVLTTIDEADRICVSAACTNEVIVVARLRVEAKSRECQRLAALAARPLPADKDPAQTVVLLNALRELSTEGIRLCAATNQPDRAATLEAHLATVDLRLIDATKVRDEALAAERERVALVEFPAAKERLDAMSKNTSSSIQNKFWMATEGELDALDAELAKYKNTSIEKSKAWLDYQAFSRKNRKTIQPHMEIIREREAKRERDRIARGREPMISAWSGSCVACEDYLKPRLNDPDSYEHVGTYKPRPQGPHWVVTMKFREKNAFGAKILRMATFSLQDDKVIDVEDL